MKNKKVITELGEITRYSYFIKPYFDIQRIISEVRKEYCASDIVTFYYLDSKYIVETKIYKQNVIEL